MLRTNTLIIIILIGIGSSVAAQGVPSSYELRYYHAGLAQPFYTQALPAWAYACNQPPVTSTITTNPTRVVWDDPQASGRTCQFLDLWAWALNWFPPGNYEATLRAVNNYGASPESTRAPFTLGPDAAAPTTVKVVR